MASVAYTIYSRYDPKDRERLERETGQLSSASDPQEQWRKESAEVYKRSLADGPVFVPAKISPGEWASYASSATLANNSKVDGDVAGWYKSLTTGNGNAAPALTSGPSCSTPTIVLANKPHMRTDKNTWFIRNVISASATTPFPFSISPIPMHTPSTPPTLAEILERDPPPSKKDARYMPPVWMTLGPGNKGFGMLQKSGWNEGEALGPYAQRKACGLDIVQDASNFFEGSQDEGKWKGKSKEATTKVEFVELPMKRARRASDDDDEIMELRKVELVDLTELSDHSGIEEEDEALDSDIDQKAEEGKHDGDYSGHGGTALLTPIPTILKSDRLGIGLKPKLVSSAASKGAYRVPVLKDTARNRGFSSKGFRVTSTQGVLNEIQRKEQEEKRARELWGRGRRGKERRRKREESERKGLLAYMNE